MSASRHCATLALLVVGAIWGTLARLGLVALNTYDGQSIEPTIWAQAVGCLIMGWVTHPKNKAALEQWYAPAFVMLGTGFCGCLTTYSSWVFRVFQAFSNELHFDRHGLHNVMDALTQTGATLGMAIASLWAGRALGDTLTIPKLPTSRYSADHVCIAIGVAFWAGAAILCGLHPPFRPETFALVLSPPGAMLRWYLSRLNSASLGKLGKLPYGTFAANVFAIAVLCAAYTAQYVGRSTGPGSLGAWTPTSCAALYGLQQGFAGSLSTVSTFTVELTTLRPLRLAFSYAFVSWTVGVIVSILLVGAPWWSLGMQGGCG
ncbi:hypothetical protein MCUN1_001938 [Malassezia cuniculi]|uniref:Fluoride ion transporter CrcB n=1 Tax=Malassezia cuniculi TaxID=948313 RepID=A0AAF0EV48_9BASI|nr:hypothetical protein MCUN1_001938 [Malassezia cuniculi]